MSIFYLGTKNKMKRLLNSKTWILILLYCLVQFTYYSLRAGGFLHFIDRFGFSKDDALEVSQLFQYIPLIGLIAAAIFIPLNRFLQKLWIYFIPIFIGISLCLIPQPLVVMTGISLFLVTGAFIKVNVLVQLFTSQGNYKYFDDRIFILLFLLVNLATFLSPLSYELFSKYISQNLAPGVPSLILWAIGGALFYRYYQNQQPLEFKVNYQSLRINPLWIFGSAFLLLLLYSLLHSRFSVIIKDTTLPNFRASLPYALTGLTGIITAVGLLYLPRYNTFQKVVTTIILLLAICCLTALFSSSESPNFIKGWAMLMTASYSILDIFIYPVLYTVVLLSFPTTWSYTGIALFMAIPQILYHLSENLGVIEFKGDLILVGLLLLAGLFLILNWNGQYAFKYNNSIQHADQE